MLERTKNPGLRSLITCTGIDSHSISAYHIGFVLGPCLNAGGRLDTAKRALELLRARTKKDADVLAGDLKALNDSRKDLTEEAVKEASEIAERYVKNGDRVLVIYLPDCHESLAGIVAGRIRERFFRPVFVLTDAENGVKGSGRSIDAYHMYEGLNQCKDLLTKFGGHKLAAGLSLEKQDIDTLRKRLNENCTLTETDLCEKVVIDMVLPFSCVKEQFIDELKLLEPFGKGNTKPVFALKNVSFLSGRVIGKKKNVLKLKLRDEDGTMMDGIYFGDIEKFSQYLDEQFGRGAWENLLRGRDSFVKLSITYYPSINEYQGVKTPQAVLTHYK